MVGNYFTVAVRNLLRHKVFSAINILGLAVGVACCVLIALYIQDEWRYDGFHDRGDRIYRVVRENVGGKINPRVEERTSGPLAPALQKDFPEVEQAVRMMGLTAKVWVRYKDAVYDFVFRTVDTHFLEVFSFPMLRGDPGSALADPYTVVMTESAARRYFGNDDPLGKTLTCEDTFFEGDYVVTGILRDIPSNSSLQFDMLTSTVSRGFQRVWENWQGPASWRPIQTYVLLAKGQSHMQLEKKLPAFLRRYLGEDAADKLAYHLQPLHRIHLYSTADYGMTQDFGLLPYGDIQRVSLFGAIAVLILLIACTNYMNLTTARSASRAKEIGIRQAAGAHRAQLVGQFLFESGFLSLLALGLGLALAALALPMLSGFLGKALSLRAEVVRSVPILFGFAVVVSLLAGGYPALFLSASRPVDVLKGRSGARVKGAWMRKGLVVFQFAIAILLIVGTAVIYKQMNFIRQKRLGYNPELLVTMPIFGMDRKIQKVFNDLLAFRYRTVKQEFLKHPGILKATAFRWDMGPEGGGMLQDIRAEGMEDAVQMRVQEADEDFLDTYGIELVSGRNFLSDIQSDLTEAFILNETAVRLLGWQNPLGRIVTWAGRRGPVIGVVKDFHDRSLREEIAPTAIVFRLHQFWSLAVRVQAKDIPGTLAFLKQTWEQFMPTRPFMYSFVDENLARMYQAEMKLWRMSQTFSMLAVFVACLGLFGLASFAAEQRTKEIGIRKVLGASLPGITLLLSKDFLKPVLVANAIAWPLAYAAADLWLQNFAYRVGIEVWPFLMGSVLAFMIALLTVSFQSVKAALANPVEALRYE